MITGINESRTLTKHLSSKCKCTLDSKKYKLNQKWNNISVSGSVKIQKNIFCSKKVIFGILQHVAPKMVNV